MKSLDPRVERLPQLRVPQRQDQKEALDQFGTFEVFVQPKDGKPFQHEGAIHAPNLEMAYILAKETFTRRFTCTSLYVVETNNVWVSPMTEGNQTVYDLANEAAAHSAEKISFEIYHLTKRGKQHFHVGCVGASTPEEAMAAARKQFDAGVVFNIWVVRTSDIRFTSDEESDLWSSLPEKKFRDASDYKGGEKLKEFLERAKKS